jgi:membrane-associated protease RseP (regulator of RpoE activity)
MAGVKKSKEKKVNVALWKIFILDLFLIIWTIYEFFINGDSTNFWILFVVSTLILLPNLLWLKLKMGTIFGIPFVFTMLRTKHTINTICALSKHGKIFEKISIGGLFLGFGLVGVDYWIAREKGGLKRIVILFFSAIILGIIFILFVSILFAVPALAPLLLLGLFSFVVLGFGGLSLAFLLGYGYLSIEALILGNQICPSVAPVLPGVPIPGLGVVIPLIAWVSLGIIMIIHEFSHGVMLSYYKEKIKSVGLILVGIIPMGAFVEQDDNTFMKKDDKKQLVVLSAGPTSNLVSILVGLIILILFYFSLGLFIPSINAEFEGAYSGITVLSIPQTFNVCGQDYNSPAFGLLVEGDKIISSNGRDVNLLIKNSLKLENNLLVYNKIFGLSQTKITDEDYVIQVLRNDEVIDVNITPVEIEFFGSSSLGPIGLELVKEKEVPFTAKIISQLVGYLDSIIFFFIILSFAVGMFNFMPANPLDGGRMAQIMLVPYFGFMKFNSKKETQKFIGRLFVWLFLISILINLLPYLTMFF